MQQPFTIDRALAAEMNRAAASEGSGILTAARGKLKRMFCLVDGRLALAVSNVIEEQLGAKLVRDGLMSDSDIAAATLDATKRDMKLSRALVEYKVLSAQQMQEALEAHICELLFSTLEWTTGDVFFEDGLPNLDSEFTASLACEAQLMRYAESHPASISLVRARIGPPSLCPVVSDRIEEWIESVEPSKATSYLLRAADGTRNLSKLVGGSPESAEVTWRAMYGLTLAGALTPKPTETETIEGSVSRDEALSRLKQSLTADHYTILGLNPGCTGDEVRNSYYFLARRYHPDRFRAGELEDLLESIESYFTKVTEAYNTLHDDDLRAEYDAQRETGEEDKKQKTADAEQDTAYLAKQNFLRATALMNRGRYTDAVSFLENAIQLDASEAGYHLALGKLLTRSPRHRPQAEERLIEAARLDPSLIEAYLALGELCVKLERLEQAGSYYREVLRWEPGHLEAEAQLKELGPAGRSGEERGGLLGGLFRS